MSVFIRTLCLAKDVFGGILVGPRSEPFLSNFQIQTWQPNNCFFAHIGREVQLLDAIAALKSAVFAWSKRYIRGPTYIWPRLTSCKTDYLNMSVPASQDCSQILSTQTCRTQIRTTPARMRQEAKNRFLLWMRNYLVINPEPDAAKRHSSPVLHVEDGSRCCSFII